MPNGKKKAPPKTRRRNYKKRSRKTFRPQTLVRVGFPKSTMVKLRYVGNSSINPTAANIAGFSIRANSCYDPDPAVGGHQPLGFDQWSQFYNHYVVVGAKITAYFTYSKDTTGSNASAYAFGIYLSDDNVITNLTFSGMAEQGLTKWRIKPASMLATVNNDASPKIVSKFSAKKFFNITNITDNTSRLGASINANPTEEAYFHIWGGDPAGTSDLPSLDVTYMVDYLVIFSEPRELIQS